MNGMRRIDWEVSTLDRLSLAARRLRGLLVAQRHRLQLLGELLLLLVEIDYVDEILAQLTPPLGIGDSAFFDVAQIDDVVEFFSAPAQLLGQFEHHELNQRRTADGLLHPQLAALHAPGQIDFAFARQQRNRAHFAQVHAYRVVGIDRFLDLLLRVEKIRFLSRFGIKELGIFVEGNAKRFVTFVRN